MHQLDGSGASRSKAYAANVWTNYMWLCCPLRPDSVRECHASMQHGSLFTPSPLVHCHQQERCVPAALDTLMK
jgi:hypothetical protein